MPTQVADDLNENAKRNLDTQREATQKSREEFANRTKGKPTPTQEENDMAAMGATFTQHEEDGADPDPNAMPIEHRNMQAKPGSSGGYQTRQSAPQQRPAPSRPSSSSSGSSAG